jgi:hypothetical protein
MKKPHRGDMLTDYNHNTCRTYGATFSLFIVFY